MEEFGVGAIAAMGGFAGGIVLGFAARWGRFCTLNAIETQVLGGDSAGLRMWGIAIATAIVGTFALDQTGLINIGSTFYLATPASLVSNCVGGLMFGIGMALVGTCGYGTLARVGGGDLKSVVTFLVMGITAYATLRGATAYIRVAIFPNPSAPDTPASFAHLLGSISGVSTSLVAYATAGLIALLCLTSTEFRRDGKKLFVGVLVGCIIVWGWLTTGYLASDEFDPYPLESFTFAAPLGETLIYAMTMSGSTLKFGIGAVLGVITGAAITSVAQGYFRWEACDDAREMRRQILGGMLMGFGSVTALGCTIGQGVTAASLLAYSAPVTLVSIYVGAWAGLHYLISGSMLQPLRQILGRA